jgi:hypothetical protein
VSTNSSYLLVHFHSDSSVTGKGFQANFDVNIRNPPGCGVLLFGQSMSINAPNADEYFCLNSGKESIYVSFNYLNTLPGYGYVEVLILLYLIPLQGSVIEYISYTTVNYRFMKGGPYQIHR